MPTSQARGRPRRRGQGGFATIDLLVAMALFVLVGTVAVMGFGGGDRARLRAEAADTALFLQQARMRALDTGRPVEVVLDGQGMRAGNSRHRFDPEVEVAPRTARVTLRPSGFSEGLALTLTSGDRRATVTVDWMSGKVAVQ